MFFYVFASAENESSDFHVILMTLTLFDKRFSTCCFFEIEIELFQNYTNSNKSEHNSVVQNPLRNKSS